MDLNIMIIGARYQTYCNIASSVGINIARVCIRTRHILFSVFTKQAFWRTKWRLFKITVASDHPWAGRRHSHIRSYGAEEASEYLVEIETRFWKGKRVQRIFFISCLDEHLFSFTSFGYLSLHHCLSIQRIANAIFVARPREVYNIEGNCYSGETAIL